MTKGRPKSNNPRKVQTRIRMTVDEASMLDECSEYFGSTKTEIVIRGISSLADIKCYGKGGENMSKERVFSKSDYEDLRTSQENLKRLTFEALEKVDKLFCCGGLSEKDVVAYRKRAQDAIAKNDAIIALCDMYLKK